MPELDLSSLPTDELEKRLRFSMLIIGAMCTLMIISIVIMIIDGGENTVYLAPGILGVTTLIPLISVRKKVLSELNQRRLV